MVDGVVSSVGNGNGTLGGLVAITGGAAYVYPWAAFIIGFIGGCVYYIASRINLYKLKIDDPLDAIAVHLACGIWGLIAVSIFAAQNLVNKAITPGAAYRFFMGGGYMGVRLLAAQLLYITMVLLWTTAIMGPYFWGLKKLGIFRVAPDIELDGLDVSHHGGNAYPYAKGAEKGIEECPMNVGKGRFGGLSEREIYLMIEEVIQQHKDLDLKTE